ncbi:hypothetical protein [Amycolatopsis sp. NPDC004625]|uniref:hypothetical protein n=1 Tax=Amycolatopsis sp. NPDC004625 TaxID=3154670 RepID=UPI0033A3AB71
MSTTLRARGITPLRMVIGLAILAALVLGSLWVGGAFASSGPHQVSVKVGGPAGTFYRIAGGPGGDTGPMSPGADYRTQFTTDKDAEDLGLLVTVTPPEAQDAWCRIEYDGKAVALPRRVAGSSDLVCSIGR